jgi:hypothetical protein
LTERTGPDKVIGNPSARKPNVYVQCHRRPDPFTRVVHSFMAAFLSFED